MTANFITTTIQHEGGWSNHISDKGGKTNMGITLETFRRFMGADKTAQDLRNLSVDDAREFYKKFFWDNTPYARLPERLHAFMFDMNVNHGPTNAGRILQHAIRRKGGKVTLDGIVGPATIAAASIITLEDLILQRIKFFADIVENNRSQQVFLRGWANRALSYME